MLYSDEQIERAKSINTLISYFQSHGYKCEREGKEIHVRGFGGLKISPDKHSYYWHTRSLGGHDAVKCMNDVFGMTFPQAVKELINENPLLEQKSDGSRINPDKYNHKNNELPVSAVKEKKEFKLPERAENYKRVYAYLINQRKISPELITALVKQNALYQDKNGNAVFVHFNKDGQAIGAEIQGTLSEKRFKGVAEGTSESVFSFIKGDSVPDTVYVFESAIDMMSYVQLNNDKIKSGEFVSMAGLKDSAIKKLAERGMKIVSCVDNDEAGQKFNKRIMEQGIGLQSNLSKSGINYEMNSFTRINDINAVTYAKAEIGGITSFFFQNTDEHNAVKSEIDFDGRAFIAPHSSDYFIINNECEKENVKDFNELLKLKNEQNELKPKQTYKDLIEKAISKIESNSETHQQPKNFDKLHK